MILQILSIWFMIIVDVVGGLFFVCLFVCALGIHSHSVRSPWTSADDAEYAEYVTQREAELLDKFKLNNPEFASWLNAKK